MNLLCFDLNNKNYILYYIEKTRSFEIIALFNTLYRTWISVKRKIKLSNKFKYVVNLAEEAFSGVNSRLEQSKRAANPRMRAEMSHVVAGRAGEEFVLKELEKLGSVRQAVRIPNMDGKRSEIDLVLQTRSHIYLFEVKNWSGSVELTPDGKWKQIR